MHEVEKEDDPFSMYEYDAISVRTLHFTTNVKYTHNANIAFDEVSSDRKLQRLLIDVTVSNKIGNKTTVCVKLDTGTSGNLLPYNVSGNFSTSVCKRSNPWNRLKKWLKHKLDSLWVAFKKVRNSYYGLLNIKKRTALQDKIQECTKDSQRLHKCLGLMAQPSLVHAHATARPLHVHAYHT